MGRWYGPIGDCSCCGNEPCVRYVSGVYSNAPGILADKFDIVSGTWVSPVNTTRVWETTGSGIILAKGAVGNATDYMTAFAQEDDNTAPGVGGEYGLVIDYSDSSNYTYTKKLYQGSNEWLLKVIRKSGGSDTDIATATASELTGLILGGKLMRYGSSGLISFGNNDGNSNTAIGSYSSSGARFGLISNNPHGDDTNCVRGLLQLKHGGVASSFDDYFLGGGTYGFAPYDGHPNNEYCIFPSTSLNTGGTHRCLGCGGFAPQTTGGSVTVTVSGITGSFGSSLNGTYMFSGSDDISGGKGTNSTCVYVRTIVDDDPHFAALTVTGLGRCRLLAIDNDNFYRWEGTCSVTGYAGGAIDCYSTTPVPLNSLSIVHNFGADADISGMTMTASAG